MEGWRRSYGRGLLALRVAPAGTAVSGSALAKEIPQKPSPSLMGHYVLPLEERGLDQAHVEWRCVAVDGMLLFAAIDNVK